MRPRVAHGFFVVGLLVTALYFHDSPLRAEAIQQVVTVAATVAVLVGMRRNGTRHRVAWKLFALALVIFIGEHVCWIANVVRAKPASGPLGNTLDLIGYLALLAGAVVALRERTRRDLGGVLDAAVLAVAGGTLIWEFIMFGRLTALRVDSAPLAITLTQLLIIVAGLGVLVRLVMTLSGSRATLSYMFAALSGGFVQIVVFPFSGTEAEHVPGSLVESAGLLALVCVGAAALHPSMVLITEPGPVTADRLTRRRLLGLGAAMATAPISVGLWQLLGHRADSVLLVVSAIAIVSLVMFRIRGLVTERENAEAALAHQALHDSLTHLPNRAHFVALLEAALGRLTDGSTAQVAVLFCDLDGFKQVNDTLGHSAGNDLLVAVAARLKRCVRSEDIVSRFGGDEFLAMCEYRTSTCIDRGIAARIATELQQPRDVGGATVSIAASVGVATTDAGTPVTAEELIHEADLAMYAMKLGATHPLRLYVTG